ncbi:unnamed protein product, partial [Effrenium voratum]
MSPDLQQLWSQAMDAWLAPPGAAGACVFMRPAQPEEAPEPQTSEWLEAFLTAAAGRSWAAVCSLSRGPGLHSGTGEIFSLTATDPMGLPQPWPANATALQLLESELEGLCGGPAGGSGARCFWRSFGFHPQEGWREDGFTVIAEAPQVLELARKHRQGAVYRWNFQGTALRRSTVPVCLADTEADVRLVPCRRPDTSLVDRPWGGDARALAGPLPGDIREEQVPLPEALISLRAVARLILDEGDRLMDEGFEEDIMALASACQRRRLTLLFSATWTSQTELLAVLLRPGFLKVTVAGIPKVIAQEVELLPKSSRARRLRDLLREFGDAKVLVFVLFKREAKSVAKMLQNEGIQSWALEGSMSQAARSFTMQ